MTAMEIPKGYAKAKQMTWKKEWKRDRLGELSLPSKKLGLCKGQTEDRTHQIWGTKRGSFSLSHSKFVHMGRTLIDHRS